MKILLIGNGFDLAHGLPTKYANFLDFINEIKYIINFKILHNFNKINSYICKNEQIHSSIRLLIPKKFGQEELAKDAEELLGLIENNFWIDYFLHCDMYEKENWIDFERKHEEKEGEDCKMQKNA